MDQNNLKVLDGGSGFEAIGICKGKIDFEHHKCWSSVLLYDNKDIVSEIYKRFLDCGCEVLTSLSYQATPLTLASNFNISIEEAEDLMAESVLLAKEECYPCVSVAASLGPYGAHLSDGSEYTGSYINKIPLSEITDMYRHRIKALVKANPDILAFETIPTLEEVKLIIEIMREYPNLKAWISMSTDDGQRTVHGDEIIDIIKMINLTDRNIFAFGVNCSINLLAVKDSITLIKEFLDPSKVVVLYPNNGKLFNRSTKEWSYNDGVNENTFYDLLPSWIEEGASWIGGCCQMGSQEMPRVVEIIKRIREKKY